MSITTRGSDANGGGRVATAAPVQGRCVGSDRQPGTELPGTLGDGTIIPGGTVGSPA